MIWLRGVLAILVLVAVGCGGDGGCTAGSTSDCSSGNICTNISGDGNQCRKICEVQSDCAVGQTCEGVANTTLKSCQ